MVDGKLRARTAAWMMLACGLPSVAWAADAEDRLRPDRRGADPERRDRTVAVAPRTIARAPNAGNDSVPMPLDVGMADAIAGRWKDIGRFKGPTLRALASRAPYFHNGSAKDLNEVVRFDDRFGIGFTDQERDDLVAFLKAL